MIYYYFNEAIPVYLLAVDPKNQQVDLTPQRAYLTVIDRAPKMVEKARRAAV